MPQSPETAGGEGFTFEGDAAAFYLAALLAEAHAPGINDKTVVCVSVQQRDLGEPLDDVIIDFEGFDGNRARLSLQVKRSLTISSAPSNKDFREIVRDSWDTLKKSNFRLNDDRYGAAVGTVSSTKVRSLNTLCEWARESLTNEHFSARFGAGGSASQGIKTVKNDISTLLEEVKGAPLTNEELYQFCAHFVLIRFDFLREGSIDPPEAINRIRDCLANSESEKAPLVWSRLVQLSRASAGKSGQFDRQRLIRLISSVARLRVATSLQNDLNKLMELAKVNARLIPDDIGGERLDRPLLLKELDRLLLAKHAVIQIRGLPGSGKSVLIRRSVEKALEQGPVLFLKAEQLEGVNWSSYASSLNLSGYSIEQLLVEIGASGTPALFIDAIDRIEKEHQPIILDLISVIVDSPLLTDWRVVVTLRDTGIEVLRNWLGDYLDKLRVETLNVDQLSDDESELLAKAKPHLRYLLFGSEKVKAIVRRPFFAKVLDQGYVTSSSAPAFAPQSEVDLIDNWWQRGGYNESGQHAIERQRALHDLARIRARQLSQPIRVSQLISVAHIAELKSDGILQDARSGISIRFAHDIFFEWAYFHLLADRGDQWLEEVRECGEPPAVARVVELVSQWEYSNGSDWPTYLAMAKTTNLRSQWLRAWLVGPLGTLKFEQDEEQFEQAAFANNFELLRKALVWFQAEKTTPNLGLFAAKIPIEQRQRYADLLGWPSDFGAWRRLIDFLLKRVSVIPQRFFPDIVAIFDVWQNACAEIPNPMSRALLQQCANWLDSIDAAQKADSPDDNTKFWAEVADLSTFRNSLVQLILRSSKAEPTIAADYLQRVMSFGRNNYNFFREIITFSPILAKSIPGKLVEVSLALLREELPDDKVARQRHESRMEAEMLKAIRSKAKSELSRRDKLTLSSGAGIRSIGDFDYHDWERLSIHDDFSSFWPPSPLREPFHSLFQSSPKEALRLLRMLCNHAMFAWRQLHKYKHNSQLTPIPLELTFPWGTQQFWGNDQEYIWFRAVSAPKSIACGLLALEEWCFSELENGRPIEELLQQVVEGNECIAVLGIAAMLALHTETVSPATLPLFTSQRLLSADRHRMGQDLTSSANLIGFHKPSDVQHRKAMQVSNSRPIRGTNLAAMLPSFVFAPDPLGSAAREAILHFEDNLPFEYEEHREIPDAIDFFTAEAAEYAELADFSNYKVYKTDRDSDEVSIIHESPTAARPENVAKAQKATNYLKESSIWTWVSESFEKGAIGSAYKIDDAIAFAKKVNSSDLFENSDDADEDDLAMRRGAVAGTAALTLRFREGQSEEDFGWASGVLRQASNFKDKLDVMWSSGSIIPWHPLIYVARGLGAELHENCDNDAASDLLRLIAHPLEVVSKAALEEACLLWSVDSKLTWASVALAFSLCHIQRHRDGASDQDKELQPAVDAAVTSYRNVEAGWHHLPPPPPAWVQVDPTTGSDSQRYNERSGYREDDLIDTAQIWSKPEVHWNSKQAAAILGCLPLSKLLESDAKKNLLDFLAEVLDWTIQKNAPHWVKAGRRNKSDSNLFEWNHSLGAILGQVAGLVPLSDFQPRFLDQILQLEGENCWMFLRPFASAYICAYVYDSEFIPPDAVRIVELCLDRFLKASEFDRESYRSGKFTGFDQPELIRILMFISIEWAGGAVRYANGEWSEIGLILPVIDRFISAGGWAAPVMDSYLTLCERANVYYPAENFADQVLGILDHGSDSLKGWHGTFIPARIAQLVQSFSHRDAPLKLPLALKFLRILDVLVDMGDRRSAALQLSEIFREIRLPE